MKVARRDATDRLLNEEAFLSYLDPPRISFAGTFQATPSTINNSTENYAPDVQFNNNPPSPANPESVWWNPSGWAFFQVLSGTVNGAYLQAGMPIISGDTVIGASVASVPTGTSQPYHQGRLVDLDPDQQARSMVVGMKLQITTTDGATVSGVVAPCCIADLWGRVVGGNGGSINWAGCMYQSVMQNVEWTGIDTTTSEVFRTLHANSPDTLSIKFNVDAYNGLGPQYPGFSTGRIVGTIGPYGELAASEPEPLHVLAQRKMYTGGSGVSPSSPMNAAPFQVKNGFLTLDLGNSVPTSLASSGLAGPFVELGPVVPVIDVGTSQQLLAPLFTTAAQFAENYQTFAGIYEVALGSISAANVPVGLLIDPPTPTGPMMTTTQAVQAKIGLQVAVADDDTPASQLIALAENGNGTFAALDFNALRMAADAPAWSSAALSGTEITSTAEVPLYATVFGAAAANQAINVQTSFNQYQFPTVPNYISNDPASAIAPAPSSWEPPKPPATVPNIATITTNQYGVGIFALTANSLAEDQLEGIQNNRRVPLGSQLYLYTHDWSMDSLPPLTILLFVNTPGPSAPTWDDDVSPIFQQYAALYPGMRQVLDLGDYGTVVANLDAFRTVMNLPMTDPSHMPVTRDLSPANLAMINAWFEKPVKEGTS